MTRYRKKPVDVEAWQVGSDETVPEWAEHLNLLEFSDGIWLINEEGLIYGVHPFIFGLTYEAVNDAED